MSRHLWWALPLTWLVMVVWLIVWPDPAISAEPYWIPNGQHLLVDRIIDVQGVNRVCGTPIRGVIKGCVIRTSDYHLTIYIEQGLPADQRACVISHEKRHATDDHDIRATNYIDCGDGTTWSEPYPWGMFK